MVFLIPDRCFVDSFILKNKKKYRAALALPGFSALHVVSVVISESG